MKMKWNRVISKSLANLSVLTIDGKEVGFVYRPKNSRTDMNAWRIHKGIGDNTQFLGHSYNKTTAKQSLENNFIA